MIENGLRSEGIPGVFQATRVVLYAKAALPGDMGSALFGYTSGRNIPTLTKSTQNTCLSATMKRIIRKKLWVRENTSMLSATMKW